MDDNYTKLAVRTKQLKQTLKRKWYVLELFPRPRTQCFKSYVSKLVDSYKSWLQYVLGLDFISGEQV